MRIGYFDFFLFISMKIRQRFLDIKDGIKFLMISSKKSPNPNVSATSVHLMKKSEHHKVFCNVKNTFYNYNQRAVQFLSNRTLNPISDIMHILGWNSASKQNGNTPKDSFEKKANCISNLVDWNTCCSQSGLSRVH